MANFAIEMPGIFFLYIYILIFFYEEYATGSFKNDCPPPPDTFNVKYTK